MGAGFFELIGRTGLGIAALTLAACSPQAAGPDTVEGETTGASATHPESGLELIPVTVTTADGAEHVFVTEVAATAEEQRQGLMFRTELQPDEAMIFPNDPPEIRSFWMRNTVIPLDIIFIGPDRRVLNIAAMTEPYSEDSHESAGPVIAVFEIAGGRSAELGIEPGARVDW